jgi:hypothetical protein
VPSVQRHYRLRAQLPRRLIQAFSFVFGPSSAWVAGQLHGTVEAGEQSRMSRTDKDHPKARREHWMSVYTPSWFNRA